MQRHLFGPIQRNGSVDDAVPEILQMVLCEMPVQAFFCDVRQDNPAWATEAAELAKIVPVLVAGFIVVVLIHSVCSLATRTTREGVDLYMVCCERATIR